MATAELTPPQPRKALKILRIGSYYTSPKLLFDLPREIRDVIWAYALSEVPLYDRRHKPGCIYHDHSSAFHIPPALLQYSVSFVGRNPYGAYHAHLRYCKTHCIRRQGFGLLKGVSKQVQRECSKIFWDNEMPVLAENAMLSRGAPLVQVFKSIPETHLQRIEKLALWQIEDFSGFRSMEYSRTSLLEFLQKMPNLVHLEIPSALLELLGDDSKVFALPKLRTLRVFAMRTAQVTNGDDFVNVYIAAGGQWTLPRCRFKSNRDGNNLQLRPPRQWCVACQDMKAEMVGLITDLQKHRARWRDWTHLVVDKLARVQPAQPGEKPYVIRCRLDEKRANHLFYVWGLPIHLPETRAIEARKAAKRENLANLVRKPPTVPIFYDDDEDRSDDFAVQGRTIFTRQHRAVEKRLDHGKLLEERENHLKKIEKAEATRSRKDTVAKSKAMENAEEELKGERKAAATRVGRRMS